jgi:hypothetical protein
MYEFKMKMTEKDISDYNIFHAENSKSMRKTMFFLKFMFPILAILLGFVLFDYSGPIFWILVLIGSVIDCIYSPKLMRWSTRRKVKLMLRDDKNGDLFLEKTVSFNTEGISLETINTSVNYNWESIVKFMESDNSYYIYVSSIQAIILPKRCIGSESDINDLRTYLNSNINNSI